MSRFYASIQGSRGEATRQGTPNSGIQGHIRGWRLGARVSMGIDNDGEDVCTIQLTSGSAGYGKERFLGKFKASDLKG